MAIPGGIDYVQRNIIAPGAPTGTIQQQAQLQQTAQRALGSSSGSILVNKRQQGNPVLKFIRSVAWEYAEITPDYVLGRTSCALFLSLRYHNLNPEYIHERLQALHQNFDLRVLLVLIDIKDPHQPLKELAKIAIAYDCTLMPAWSTEEAGRYLETYKAYEHKPPDSIRPRLDNTDEGRINDCLTTIRSINKTDVGTLLTNYKNLQKIIEAPIDELSLLPGVSSAKATRLWQALHQPFLKANEVRDEVDLNTEAIRAGESSSHAMKTAAGSAKEAASEIAEAAGQPSISSGTRGDDDEYE